MHAVSHVALLGLSCLREPPFHNAPTPGFQPHGRRLKPRRRVATQRLTTSVDAASESVTGSLRLLLGQAACKAPPRKPPLPLQRLFARE